MKQIGVIEVDDAVALALGERRAVSEAIEMGNRYGFGNIVAHLLSAWAVKLIDQGMSKEAAIEHVSNRTPYPLPKQLKTKTK